MPKKQDWEQRLSGNAKAEILGAVIHLLRDHMRDKFELLPPWYQEQIRLAMWHCGVDFDILCPRDLTDIREYFQEMDKNPKAREPRPDEKTKSKNVGGVGPRKNGKTGSSKRDRGSKKPPA